MTFAASCRYLNHSLIVASGIPNLKNYMPVLLQCSCTCINNHKVIRRTIFNGSNKKEYHGRKLVGYSSDQLFNVVQDVENYYKFVPWCKKSLVRSRTESHLRADLVVGFPPIIERYTSDVLLVRPYLVKAECRDGRLFNYLMTLWRLSPGLQNQPNSCLLDFRVMFEFKSVFHSHLANLFFDQVVLQMQGAFIKEAGKRFGRPSIPMQILETNQSKVRS